MYLSLIQLLCYCIGYTSNNDWSTSIIPLGQYQEKLQERRREWEASQPVEPEDRREIDRLTRVLQERERELQEERREKEQVRNRLQQQLEGRERQLQQAQQQEQERERQAREQVQDLQRQLQEKERESEQQIQEGMEREQDFQRQLQSREREFQEREQQLQRQVEGGQQREQDLQRQLQEREQQLEEREREFQERERQLEEWQIQVAESSWVVNRREIIMTEVVLGKGGWGEVKVAGFRGLKVAAKCLYEVIISPYNIGTFSREMNIASKIRHPNLLQFIGATTEGNPMILTELMPTSLRKELETGGLAYPAILSISLDVACALNYLHLFKPHPILHRDVSSANVLLQIQGSSGWRAKVSDYGTVSLQPLARTSNPGNPVYSAPESFNPREHSPAMDVFSYGVLLIEMVACQFPDVGKRMAQIKAIKRPAFKNLIERCLIENYKERPAMSDIIKELNESI